MRITKIKIILLLLLFLSSVLVFYPIVYSLNELQKSIAYLDNIYEHGSEEYNAFCIALRNAEYQLLGMVLLYLIIAVVIIIIPSLEIEKKDKEEEKEGNEPLIKPFPDKYPNFLEERTEE